MPPRPVRFTTAEVAYLLDTGLSPVGGPVMDRVVRKLQAAVAPATPNPAVQPLEEALVGAAGAKVARLAGPSGYARASRRAAQLAATPEQVATVGRWAARWWSRGTFTLLDVFARWDTWLPKALAEAPPKGIPEGLNGGRAADMGPGTGPTSGTGTPGRRPPGLR